MKPKLGFEMASGNIPDSYRDFYKSSTHSTEIDCGAVDD
jgi:hypothetical protein